MSDWIGDIEANGGRLRTGLTGRQAYVLKVPGATSAAALSVVSMAARGGSLQVTSRHSAVCIAARYSHDH